MKTDFHHVYSKGEKVIFRDKEDYIYFQNRLAIEKYGKDLKILAFSVMSTHIHLIVETWDEAALNDFINSIKWAYAGHFKRKYGESLPKEFFQISYSDKECHFEDKKSQLIYVLKNPVHHEICGSPFEYDFSSAKYTFWNELHSDNICQAYSASLRKVSELKSREVHRILSSRKVDCETTLFEAGSEAISPLSIIDIPKVSSYWRRYVRGYILDLHINPKDSKGEYIDEDSLCMQADKLSDVEVCKVIDDFAHECGARSFAFLNDGQKKLIQRSLYDRFISKAQIERCLWI